MKCFICLDDLDKDFYVTVPGFSGWYAKEPAHIACNLRMRFVKRLIDDNDWGPRNWDYQHERADRRYKD